MSTPVNPKGRVLQSTPPTPGSPGDVTTRTPTSASPAVAVHTGRSASPPAGLEESPAAPAPASPASPPRVTARDRGAQHSPRANASPDGSHSSKDFSPFTESSSDESDLEASPPSEDPVPTGAAAEPELDALPPEASLPPAGLIPTDLTAGPDEAGPLRDEHLYPEIVAGLECAHPAAALTAAYRQYGIPLTEQTLPQLVYVGELDDSNRIGGGTTGQAFQVIDDVGETRAFKPCTGEFGLGGDLLGLRKGAPNLEGRSLLASGIAARFFPKGCPAAVPDARMAIASTSKGKILGLDMGYAPGKAHLTEFVDPGRKLDRTCTAYACLLPLRGKDLLVQLQSKILGVHKVDYIEAEDGGTDIALQGQALRYPRDVLEHPDFKRALTWLQLFDIIMGQADRHSGNILVHVTRHPETRVIKSVSVTGIDNDLCCGLNNTPDTLRRDMEDQGYGYFVSLYPEVIDKEMLQAVISWTPDELLVAGKHFLNDDARARAFKQRLVNLQKHCMQMRTRPGKVIAPGDWDKVRSASLSPAHSLAARETINAYDSLTPGPMGLPPKVVYQPLPNSDKPKH